MEQIKALVSKAVLQALTSSSRVWVYRVSKSFGKEQEGQIALSKDYLLEEVAEQVLSNPGVAAVNNSEWLRTNLPKEIEAVLGRHKVRSGYAVLAGVVRPVWVLPQADIKLKEGKSVRSQFVEVLEKIR